MSDFDRLINASDLTEWVVESFPDWCEGDVRSILDHIYEMPTHPTPSNTLGALDCVDRQAAVDAIEEMQKPIMRSNFSHEQFIFRGMSEARQAIIDLPSVQPRKGKWIEYDDGWANVYYECSVCKEPFVLIDGTPADNLYNFCPKCGADMRGDSE